MPVCQHSEGPAYTRRTSALSSCIQPNLKTYHAKLVQPSLTTSRVCLLVSFECGLPGAGYLQPGDRSTSQAKRPDRFSKYGQIVLEQPGSHERELGNRLILQE